MVELICARCYDDKSFGGSLPYHPTCRGSPDLSGDSGATGRGNVRAVGNIDDVPCIVTTVDKLPATLHRQLCTAIKHGGSTRGRDVAIFSERRAEGVVVGLLCRAGCGLVDGGAGEAVLELAGYSQGKTIA